MPWTTPTLESLRKQNRDNVTARLGGGAMIPNSVLRVMSDANAGLAYLTLLYLDWLSRQFLPDTAEGEWLRERHAKIWLGGWKQASFASGRILVSGVEGNDLPEFARLTTTVNGTTIEYETTAAVAMGSEPVEAPVRALVAGKAGNLDPGAVISFSAAISGVDGSAEVVEMTGGADEESEDLLRERVLLRIQSPPMGGDADDYVRWALEVPGVTRAWCAPNEMGIGTVTLRFMMDDLRADNDGFPTNIDVVAVTDHLDQKRPVAVKDRFVVAPLRFPVSFDISNLVPNTAAVRAAIRTSVDKMIRNKAAPAHTINGVTQPATTIHREWVSAAILAADGVESFELDMEDAVPPSPGHKAELGTIGYA